VKTFESGLRCSQAVSVTHEGRRCRRIQKSAVHSSLTSTEKIQTCRGKNSAGDWDVMRSKGRERGRPEDKRTRREIKKKGEENVKDLENRNQHNKIQPNNEKTRFKRPQGAENEQTKERGIFGKEK
jgi:hypothetical protein